jgi:valyl-tRNA synthetase
VVKGLLHHDEIPWHHTTISGWALDPKGKKMSKSKGNVIEPEEVREKYSADGLRLWASGSKLGEDLSYKEKDLVTAKKFLTKLWNASKFAGSHLEGFDGKGPDLHPTDRWILSRMNQVVKDATALFEEYKYSKVRKLASNFFLHEFCDNYLEMCKFRLYGDDVNKEARASARYALYNCLLASVKMMAPFIPYMTEEIYQTIFRSLDGAESVHVSAWPEVDEELLDEEAENSGSLVTEVVGSIRRYKAENGMPLNAPLDGVIASGSFEDTKTLRNAMDTIKGSMNISDFSIKEGAKHEEEITGVEAEFSVIGPEFKGDANWVVEKLKGLDSTGLSHLKSTGVITFDKDENTSYTIKEDHIKKWEIEFSLEGEKVETINIEGTGITIFIKKS